MSEAFETLPPSEWGRLKDIFVRDFQTDETPDPERFEIRARVEDGEIVAFYMLERRVTHGGPFWVREDRRRQGLARAMALDALELTEGEEGYIAATTPEVERLAEELGLVKVRGSLWCKERSDVR